MKKIKYQLLCKQEKTVFDDDGNPSVVQEDALSDIETTYTTKEEYERICTIAYNGEVTIYDDGQQESDTSTTDDVLNALLGVTV